MSMQSDFIGAIHDRRRVMVTFSSIEDGGALLVRECAPMDYGPTRIDRGATDRYHLWDYDSDSADGRHQLMPVPGSIVSIAVLASGFEPADFVTWTPNWTVARDWGAYS